jgi:hypothetical protein
MTAVKNPAQAKAFRLPVGTPIAIAVPPGIDPQGLVSQWECAFFKVPAPFGWFWRYGGPNDYKLLSPLFDAFGNFEYGATGAAAGYSSQDLEFIGSALHGGSNNSRLSDKSDAK